MENLWLLLAGLIAYLLGSIPTAFLIVRKAKGKAVWLEGSGNVGTMNIYRATGSLWLMALTLIIDMGKAALALYIASLLCGSVLGQVMAAVFAVLGHNYSVFIGFRGGRGLACLLGIMLYLNWIIAFLCFGIVVASIFTTEYLMRRRIKGVKKVFGEQILGRVIGMAVCVVVIPFLVKEGVYVALLLASALSFVEHIQRLKDYLKNNHP